MLQSAARHLREQLKAERVTPAAFAAVLDTIPVQDRDAWLDLLCESGEIPSDDELPRGCVPYLPCAVQSVLEALQLAAVTPDDVFIDVGAGAGRAAVLAHLKTGATCIGLEIQRGLVEAARARADHLKLSRVRFVAGDAADTIRSISMGTVFFLYCPFGGERLRRFF